MYNPHKEFGDIPQRIDMGRKWETTYDDNPPPGIYNVDGGVNLTKTRAKSAFIKKGSGFKVQREDNPDAGQYEPFQDYFSNIKSKITMGNKYITKYDENPPPGIYDTEAGTNMTRSRSTNVFIRKDTGYKVLREDNPDAGQYEPNLGKEGREMGNIR